jgi:putative flippase GtrA
VLRQYVKFVINGGILGVMAWGLQTALFVMLGGDSAASYGIATALTYVPLVILNFSIQRAWIFGRPGLFWQFVAANLTIMALVSLLSPVMWYVIDELVGPPWGNRGGFAVAALLASAPSFLLKRYWVFRVN